MVVVDPADYPRVLEQLARPGGPTLAFKFELMQKAFAHTAQFDGLIAMTMQSIDVRRGDAFRRDLPPKTAASAEVKTAALRREPAPEGALGPGARPELADPLGRRTRARSCRTRTCSISTPPPASCSSSPSRPPSVIKHTNPCGAATGATIADAYVAAREADPLSAFGGIVGLNREIDADTATALTSTFIEAVIAPSFTEEAKAILAKKTNLRVVTADFDAMAGASTVMGHGDTAFGTEMRIVPRRDAAPGTGSGDRGAEALSQPARDSTSEMPKDSGRHEAAADRRRVDGAAVRVAGVRAREVEHDRLHRRRSDAGGRGRADEPGGFGEGGGDEGGAGLAEGSVVASDAFFPFRDGLDAVADAGATAVVQPGGSVQGRRSDCRRRRARAGDGLYGAPPFPALTSFGLKAGATYRCSLRACCGCAVAVYFVALGNSAIWDANEAFYVETPREMIEANDFVNPTFNYLPRFNKPVLSYWIVAGFYKVFGVSVARAAPRHRARRPDHHRAARSSWPSGMPDPGSTDPERDPEAGSADQPDSRQRSGPRSAWPRPRGWSCSRGASSSTSGSARSWR